MRHSARLRFSSALTLSERASPHLPCVVEHILLGRSRITRTNSRADAAHKSSSLAASSLGCVEVFL